MRRKVKVLIVEDSLLFREILVKEITKDSYIEVVGCASDPYSARDKIIELQPDVMTLDLQLPRMDGREFLKKLIPQYPLPVVVVTGSNSSVFEALEAGAIDFVYKPQGRDRKEVDNFIKELIIKIKIASTAKVSHHDNTNKALTASKQLLRGTPLNKIIAIGASTGGTEAIYEVIKELPADIPGIVIVQHMPPVFTRMYAERLNNESIISVKEAVSGDEIIPGRALVAPGDFHMAVRKKGKEYFVECFKGDKVNGHCPSVDVLFNSVAEEAGKNAIGIILTGMGFDGAKGLKAIREKRGRTIGQDEQSSVIYGMPKVAYEIGAVEKQLSLVNIPKELCHILDS